MDASLSTLGPNLGSNRPGISHNQKVNGLEDSADIGAQSGAL
jgi:hypothetical protein